MAAPSGTSWSSGSTGTNYQGCIGLYVTQSSNQTQTTVTVQIWYWSQYSCSDSSNTFYFDWASSASSSIGGKSINTGSNHNWDTANQVLIGTYSKTYNRGTSNSTQYCSARFTGIEYGGGNSYTCTTSFTIPAKNTYTITYNANGGSGAPASHSYFYGNNTTLSNTRPTRAGYTFLGWSLNSDATSPSYSPGQAWSGTNASNYTLYAVWQLNTYTITYNANGGDNAPSQQTKTHGQTLTLSSQIPTRPNYNFVGWSTNSSASGAEYQPGGAYYDNSNATLYAVWDLAYWSPKITNVYVNRCDSDGANNEEGRYAKVSFKWECCQIIGANDIKSATVGGYSASVSGTSGTTDIVIGNNSYEPDYVYNISIIVVDSKNGTSTYDTYVDSTHFAIDFKAGGTGVAIGMPAKQDNLFAVNFPAEFYETIKSTKGIMSEEGNISGHEVCGSIVRADSDIIVADESIYDFVIADGRSGIWTYRKWRSGFAECWCVTSNNVAANTKWGNAFYSTYLQGGYALPFTFATNGDIQDDPQGFVEIQSPGGNYWFQVANSCTTTNAPKGYVMCPVQHNNAISVLFSFYIRGRWK